MQYVEEFYLVLQPSSVRRIEIRVHVTRDGVSAFDQARPGFGYLGMTFVVWFSPVCPSMGREDRTRQVVLGIWDQYLIHGHAREDNNYMSWFWFPRTYNLHPPTDSQNIGMVDPPSSTSFAMDADIDMDQEELPPAPAPFPERV